MAEIRITYCFFFSVLCCYIFGSPTSAVISVLSHFKTFIQRTKSSHYAFVLEVSFVLKGSRCLYQDGNRVSSPCKHLSLSVILLCMCILCGSPLFPCWVTGGPCLIGAPFLPQYQCCASTQQSTGSELIQTNKWLSGNYSSFTSHLGSMVVSVLCRLLTFLELKLCLQMGFSSILWIIFTSLSCFVLFCAMLCYFSKNWLCGY